MTQDKVRDRKSGLWKPALLLGVIVAIVVLSSVFHVGDKLIALRDWIHSLGILGPIAFMLIYAVATVAALPGSALAIVAAALFGPWIGVITVIIAATVGASLAFLVSRYFAREAIVRWLSRNEKFQRLDNLTEKHGDIIIAITRLVPIFPFNLLNYGFGLTKVSFRTYVMWSGLCMLPGTILYVVGSAALFKAIAEGRVPWVLIVVVAMMLGIITVLARQARQRLRDG
ncbi:MAG: TVP38/TMEM64 family protein [Deltaproteobacteria bacterium]|nr:TVP38/TMEM64 family protein [Deltaproteobacteria bacterium]